MTGFVWRFNILLPSPTYKSQLPNLENMHIHFADSSNKLAATMFHECQHSTDRSTQSLITKRTIYQANFFSLRKIRLVSWPMWPSHKH